jgi:Methyltransferase domain
MNHPFLKLEGLAQNARPVGRGPVKQVSCLLPVWGYAYVRKFMELALPTWLAPGNLPAIAQLAATEFVFLTSREDELYIRTHPAFNRLSKVCNTRVHFVDHLITGNNYSTTITLSYLEAVRGAGETMLDTCFLFLVSDYIVADGSFRSVVDCILAGRSGVQVGNFQVVEEDALAWLTDKQQTDPTALKLPPRELMKWALSHLHPATVANTVNYPITHNDHTNRLFWRVDNHTLIGRFYLMHMIGIRPETRDFVIGSSCDYSFIPEMCPSGNVEIITDSDNYLVIELQPRNHESHFLKSGPHSTAKLARSLSEWTTAHHRANSKATVVFHASEIPQKIDAAISEADGFLNRVASRMSAPRRHRNHPYWKGAMAAFNEATGAKLVADEWRRALGMPDPELDRAWFSRWVIENLRFAFFGKPPHVRPWHPRYRDYSLIIDHVERLKLDGRSHLLLVADIPTIFTASFSDGGERVVRLRSSHMLQQPQEVYDGLRNRFDLCLLEIDELDFEKADELLDKIAPMMHDNATALVSILNRRAGDRNLEFQVAIGKNGSRLLRPYSRSLTFFFVKGIGLRERSLRWMMQIARITWERPVLGMPALFILGPPLALLSAVAGWLATVRLNVPPKSYISSMLARITIDAERANEIYEFSGSRVLRKRKLKELGLPADHKLPPRERIGQSPPIGHLLTGRETSTVADGKPADELDLQPVAAFSDGTREPQYNRCLDIRDQQGLTPLGLMTNQVWEDDPRRLAFLLARYKFVSKMLSGKKFVGELGCGDGFGTRIVMQTVDKVVAYDFDPIFVEDIRQRRSARWPLEALYHDILEAKLPNLHDAIYSLDVIEHIPLNAEHLYLKHLRDSLTEDGLLIVGSPSLESQAYASPPSKAGHVNCKSGEELKALLQNYFHNVFLFSMNDEVVHTGFAPMAHYLFAVCCQKRV